MTRIAETGNIRHIVWQGSLETFKQAPLNRKLVGYGPGNFAYAFLKFRPVALNQTAEWDLLFNKAHNEFLDLLINQGLLGLGAYLLFIGVFTRWFIRTGRHSKNGVLILGIYCGWLSLLLTSFFGFLISVTKLMFWALPALAFCLHNPTDKKVLRINLSARVRQALALIAIILTTLSIFHLYQIFQADIDYAKANRLTKINRHLEAFVFYKSAIHLNPQIPHYHRDYAVSLTQFALLEELRFKREASLSEQEAVAEIEGALSLNPLNSLTLRSAIGVYQSLGQLDTNYLKRALETANRATTQIPTDSTLYYLKTDILIKQSNLSQAKAAFQQAVSLKPDHPQRTTIEQELTLLENSSQ